MIELRTDRLSGGFEGDRQPYRPEGELEALRARDPLPRLEAKLIAAGALGAEEAVAMMENEREHVRRAIDAALSAPWPDPREARTGVFAVAGAEEPGV